MYFKKRGSYMVESDDSEQPENKSSEENESDDEPLGSLKFKKNLEKVQRNKSLTKESTINSDDDLLIEVKSAKKIALKDVQSSASSVDRKCSKISISNSEDELLIDIKVNKPSALKDNNNKTLNKLGLDMDIPDIRKSSRKRKTASKFTTLINDVGLDSDDSKKKVRDQINEKGDSDSDFDNNSDGEDGDDVSENSSNHDEGITDLSYAMIKETYNPCVVLDLNFNLPKSAKSSKETETFKNKNDTDNPTVKKLFNLRSSAKKPDTVRKSKLKNSVKKSNNTSRLRKRLADEDYECNSDKSSNASDEDSSSDFEDTKKKNVQSSKKTSPKIESDDEREPQKNVSSKLISPDISDNVEVSVGIDQDPPESQGEEEEKNECEDEKKEDKNKEDEKKENKNHENVIRARVLTNSSGGDGQSIYGFSTPKRKDALAKIAQNVIESARKSSKKSSKAKTPLPAKTPSNSKTPNAKTPSNAKSKGTKDDKTKDVISEIGRKMQNRVTLAHTLVADESESSEEEEADSDFEESDSEEKSSVSKKKAKEDKDILDEYFEVHNGKTKSVTSDKTLAKLKQPKMDRQELLEHLKDIQTSHVEETIRLHSLHSQYFDKWMYQLLSGFNVVLYGLGSKHMLLEKFRRKILKDKVHIVVNGFFPSIQLKQILKMITCDILERETMFKNTVTHYKYIKEEYDSGTAGKLFIILHNIDGHMLRSQNVQTALGHLASSKNIHVIASIDHINAPLIWDQNRASAFNWVWYDVTTFEPYTEETSYENSLMVQQTGTLALSSLKHVLISLTSNAKGIFRVLADYHIDNEDNSSYQGMSFNDLYQRCRERFLVNSDLALRAQLTEFKDHKLLKTKKGYDGVEYLAVSLDCSTLKVFLEEEDG